MPEPAALEPPQDTLSLLCAMRAVTIAMQLLLIAVVVFVFDANISVVAVAAILLFELAVNLLTFLRIQSGQPLFRFELLANVLFDVVILALLIAFTGGGLNPFTGFFIVPVIIAAISLNRGQTWLVVTVSVLAYLALSLQGMPNSHHAHGASQQLANIHLYGMFFSFLIAAILVAVFVTRLAAGLRLRDQQLFKAQQLAEANQQIHALGMLAAGAAHELGTPLNSLALIADELHDAAQSEPSLQALANNHSRQVQRCKQSLDDLMSATGSNRANAARKVQLASSLKALANRWQASHPDVVLLIRVNMSDEATLVVDTLLEKALVNLLDNAAAASPNNVCFSADIIDAKLVLCIQDQGQGIDQAVVDSLNEPAGLGAQQFGFGLFWVKAFSLRVGGDLIFCPLKPTGTQASLVLPYE